MTVVALSTLNPKISPLETVRFDHPVVSPVRLASPDRYGFDAPQIESVTTGVLLFFHTSTVQLPT